jgi:hypothetical protein
MLVCLPIPKRWERHMRYSWRWVFSFFFKKYGWGKDMGNSRRFSYGNYRGISNPKGVQDYIKRIINQKW